MQAMGTGIQRRGGVPPRAAAVALDLCWPSEIQIGHGARSSGSGQAGHQMQPFLGMSRRRLFDDNLIPAAQLRAICSAASIPCSWGFIPLKGTPGGLTWRPLSHTVTKLPRALPTLFDQMLLFSFEKQSCIKIIHCHYISNSPTDCQTSKS